jgi:hypothetical protein
LLLSPNLSAMLLLPLQFCCVWNLISCDCCLCCVDVDLQGRVWWIWSKYRPHEMLLSSWSSISVLVFGGGWDARFEGLVASLPFLVLSESLKGCWPWSTVNGGNCYWCTTWRNLWSTSAV